MSSHPGLPMKNVWWIDSNSYSQEAMSSKTRMEHWCLQFSICHYSLHTLDFVGHPIFQLESILMTITLNQTTRGQTLWRSVHLETDITTCSHIAEIDNSAFSDVCKSYPFLCSTSKKVTGTWLRCKHCMAIASSPAGQVLITSLQAKYVHKHYEL